METTNKQLLKENQNLQELLLKAQSLLAEKELLLTNKEVIISTLLEQLKLARHQKFSPTSEKQSPQQDELFDEAEHLASLESTQDDSIEDEKNTESPTPRKKQKRGRSVLPAHLKRVDIIHDLEASEKFCPHDGQPLHKIGV